MSGTIKSKGATSAPREPKTKTNNNNGLKVAVGLNSASLCHQLTP